MNLISDGCRLCLDSSAERFTTIDSPALKDQMEKVFCFLIEPQQGYCSDVCQNCSHTISEFYQYSEKVRNNQEVLNGNVANCGQAKNPKISLESVKQEPLNDFELPETLEDAHESENEVSEREEEEETPILDSKISQVNDNDRTPSDFEMMETNQDASELIDEVSEVEEAVHTLHSEITLEDIKIENTDSDFPETIDEEEIPILDSMITFQSDKFETPNESEFLKITEQIVKKTRSRKEEDELFKKQLSMVCDLCGILADSYPALCSHLKEEHKRRHGYVVCCNKKLFRRCDIRDHINFHTNPDMFRCEVCGRTFARQDTLNIHMLKKHPQTHKCEHCPQSFVEESALSEHIKLHVKCPKCNQLCTKNSFHDHMFRMHGVKTRTITCDICYKEFTTNKYLKQHMKTHMEIQGFQCKICQQTLSNEKNLNHHMQKQHAPELQCDQCPKKFKNPQSLTAHKHWWHSEPKHKCEYCDKKFKKTVLLKEHLAVAHTGEVLYTCEYCGISKNRILAMNKHKRRIHPAEWTQHKLMKTKRIDSSEK